MNNQINNNGLIEYYDDTAEAAYALKSLGNNIYEWWSYDNIRSVTAKA